MPTSRGLDSAAHARSVGSEAGPASRRCAWPAGGCAPRPCLSIWRRRARWSTSFPARQPGRPHTGRIRVARQRRRGRRGRRERWCRVGRHGL